MRKQKRTEALWDEERLGEKKVPFSLISVAKLISSRM